MYILKNISEVRTYVEGEKRDGKKIGFVPTMGALHTGHLQLVKIAGSKADSVIVSIFVNPTQFGPGEDFEAYPRTLEDDISKCREAGASAVFCPKKDEIYAPDNRIQLSLSVLGDSLCGASRQGHFNGVIQIVNKLFNIVTPDVAVFGQKDIQQFRIIEQMTAEFNHNIEIVMGETVRAADGLALSSRNRYLTKQERLMAPELAATLGSIANKLQSMLNAEPEHWEDFATKIQADGKARLEKAGFLPDYIQIVGYKNLAFPDTITTGGKYIIAGAAWLGKARLIDNIIVRM
ncbi:MAG: pantoate--beta-alanine ligase [Balneolales bacterium]|nr:pantoate--beta-alanine ligase [Balneolales bacterium]